MFNRSVGLQAVLPLNNTEERCSKERFPSNLIQNPYAISSPCVCVCCMHGFLPLTQDNRRDMVDVPGQALWLWAVYVQLVPDARHHFLPDLGFAWALE